LPAGLIFLTGGTYGLRRSDGLRWFDVSVRANFHKDRFRYSKFVSGVVYTHREHIDLTSPLLLLFFKKKKGQQAKKNIKTIYIYLPENSQYLCYNYRPFCDTRTSNI
jgi:hypothetical protein